MQIELLEISCVAQLKVQLHGIYFTISRRRKRSNTICNNRLPFLNAERQINKLTDREEEEERRKDTEREQFTNDDLTNPILIYITLCNL